MSIKNIIFDFGGVLMDWNPRYLYQNYFNDNQKMEYFLHNICTDAWNTEQDRGRSLTEATDLLVQQYPGWEKEIRMYYSQWTTMLRSDIPQNVAVLKQLHEKYPLYGLTNWSAELFPYAFDNYNFFKLFKGIVVSGAEKLIKPNPEIFIVLLNRYGLKAEESVFIDDNINNIKTAKTLGFNTIHCTEENSLATQLKNLGLLL